ncbi:MAG TPA: extracellular solute-binding protein [Candidatus Avipropionibacterium avicola]|uniref:Extracellular solute-binding protein n=1 Tax=Candidatus Avipropionibacterium avicola TaxID=2840701 RepID=A0A9D1H044_9ACTN|nr:extracellular solute-binding protein [Candidatus Avipropionibacterium avicola]
MFERVTRRSLLGAAVATTTGLAVGCRTEDAGGGGAEGGGEGDQLVYPQHIAYDGPQPDLAGDTETGVPDGYLSYPDPPVSTGRVPLDLSAPVELFVQGTATATAMDRNQWWQKVNADLGTEISLTAVDSTQYLQKFQTSVAGEALGDLTQIVVVPQLPKLLDKLFTDLTEHLSGDAVANYPNLANIPPAAWQVTTFDGKIWGVPQARVPAGRVMLTRGDVFEARGIELIPDLADGEAFLDLCREVHDPDNDLFAFGQLPNDWTVPEILESLGAPNGWSVDDAGNWTNAYETPEYERALEIVAGMFGEGLYHPNSFSDPASSHTWFDAGVTAMLSQDFANWQSKAQVLDTPVGALVMPQWDGGGTAAKHLGAPAYTAPVGLSKIDDADRIDELLTVLDYIASPFGSQEYLTVNFGIEGRQWDLKDGDIMLDPDRPDEAIRGLNYAGSAIWRDIYTPGRPELTEMIHQYCAEQIPAGIADPSRGKYSETAVTKAPTETRKLGDLQGEIIQGRKPLSDWAPAVQQWRDGVGSKIADEYAAQG